MTLLQIFLAYKLRDLWFTLPPLLVSFNIPFSNFNIWPSHKVHTRYICVEYESSLLNKLTQQAYWHWCSLDELATVANLLHVIGQLLLLKIHTMYNMRKLTNWNYTIVQLKKVKYVRFVAKYTVPWDRSKATYHNWYNNSTHISHSLHLYLQISVPITFLVDLLLLLFTIPVKLHKRRLHTDVQLITYNQVIG